MQLLEEAVRLRRPAMIDGTVQDFENILIVKKIALKKSKTTFPEGAELAEKLAKEIDNILDAMRVFPPEHSFSAVYEHNAYVLEVVAASEILVNGT